MSERFFVGEPIRGATATLAPDEARHLVAVMRAKPGDEVTLFDGGGAEFVARITAVLKHSVELAVIERREVSRELSFDLTVAVALPKGERQKWLVEKLTELGVTRLVPLVTERGVAQPVEAALERLRRTVIEASKQCGRNRLMEIAGAESFATYVRRTDLPALRLVGDVGGRRITATDFRGCEAVVVAIGPEGGFAGAEMQSALASGWQAVSLGERILRVETAAIALAAVVACLGSSPSPLAPG